LTDAGHTELLLHIEHIAGIASHGLKLIGLKEVRREEFRKLTAESFAARWPQIAQKITVDETPLLRQLMDDTEEARQIIKRVLGA
jgi:hypothetical protein